MRTGEGKTRFVATLPAYLNAPVGKGVHIGTVNDYLSRREMLFDGGRFILFLGLSVSFLITSNHLYDKCAYAI